MPDNLKGATKKAIHQSKVDQLDNFGGDVEEYIQQEGLSAVERVVGRFIERVHDNINNSKGMVVTGEISNITIEAKDNVVNVLANPYLLYQDRGVNGSVKKLYDTPHSYTDRKPPVQVFIDWIKQKNIQLKDNEKYDKKDGSPFKELTEEDKIRNAAFGMATNVFKYGFKPRKIYSKEIPKLVEDLQEEAENFVVQQVVQLIDVKPSAKRVTKA